MISAEVDVGDGDRGEMLLKKICLVGGRIHPRINEHFRKLSVGHFVAVGHSAQIFAPITGKKHVVLRINGFATTAVGSRVGERLAAFLRSYLGKEIAVLIPFKGFESHLLTLDINKSEYFLFDIIVFVLYILSIKMKQIITYILIFINGYLASVGQGVGRLIGVIRHHIDNYAGFDDRLAIAAVGVAGVALLLGGGDLCIDYLGVFMAGCLGGASLFKGIAARGANGIAAVTVLGAGGFYRADGLGGLVRALFGLIGVFALFLGFFLSVLSASVFSGATFSLDSS